MTRRATMYAMERALIRCADALESEGSAKGDEAAKEARAAVALFRRDGPPEPKCPHGKTGECNACDIAGDFAYDAAREDRVFGRGAK